MGKNSELKRLLSHVKVQPKGCWDWTGAVFPGNGYGAFRVSRPRETWLAHRRSFILHGKGDPGGMFVCHRCDNRRCVNPEHLFLGTHQDNVDDMVSKGRHCREQSRVEATLGAKRVALRKLSEEQAWDIFRRHLLGESGPALAREYRVHRGTVHNLVTGRSWSHVTGVPCPRHHWRAKEGGKAF